MANAIIRNIPNTLTCCNLFSGCVASCMAFQGEYAWTFIFIVIGAVFDFFDGMMARLLHVSSSIGKELDSLADDITFGLAPAAIAFSLFQEVHYPGFIQCLRPVLPYTAFLIAVFSGLRLAKFNIDERQTSSFIGVPTPANALFWASLVTGGHSFLVSSHFNALYLFVLVVVMSLLLVVEVPMFSLKFKDLSWKHNKVSYIFLIVSIPLLVLFRLSGFAAVIVWYILWSLVTRKKS